MFQKMKEHQFLFEELVARDFKTKYKRTVLGMLWSVLNPLLTLLVMKIVFTQFCGNLVFSYFNESTTQGMTALVSNSSIFTKVNVPKYMFLFSKNVQTIINFGITLCVFFVFCLFDHITFTWKFFLLVIPIVCLMVFNIGVGLILSALYVFFKDIQYLWGVFTMLLMYMSAIFYTTSSYSPLIQNLFLCNPVYVYITYFRQVVIDGLVPSAGLTALAVGYAVVAFGIGAIIYKKKNHDFLYYV